MLQIRLSGTKEEINSFLDKLSQNNNFSEARKVSKFYPNRELKKEQEGRVYFELEIK